MKLHVLLIAILLLACSKQPSEEAVEKSTQVPTVEDTTAGILNQSDIDSVYLISTYDYSDRNLDAHKANLKELSDSGAFSVIHSVVFSILNNKHQSYFSSNLYYELLFSTHGNLFQNNKEDFAFIVYDKRFLRISIVVYDDSKNTYLELYRDIKVNNGLKTVECNYGSFGTLDYQIGEELIYQRDYIIKNPKLHLEYSVCKIVEITKDDDFVLEEACFVKGFSSEGHSLCISTSSVYNSWECLTYYPNKNVFVIFYGQAFAD